MHVPTCRHRDTLMARSHASNGRAVEVQMLKQPEKPMEIPACNLKFTECHLVLVPYRYAR